MSEDDETPAFRTYWHSDHYRSRTNGLVGPVWDALTDHPAGLIVPRIRDVLVNDRRVRARQSWLLSFGSEQRHRVGSTFADRYRAMDPAARMIGDEASWTWTDEQRYKYALTERVHHSVRNMVKEGQAVLLGISEDAVENSEILHLIVGRSRQNQGRLPLYGPGDVPTITGVNPRCECGKVHHKTYKRPWIHHEELGPDPFILRQNWAQDVRTAIAKDRLTNARELLERGLFLMKGMT